MKSLRLRMFAQVFAVLAVLFGVPVFAPRIDPVCAQSTNGRLVITAKDTTGALVAGATVTVTNEGTSTSVTATTNENGLAVFPQLAIGRYTVTVEVEGFKKAVSEGVKIDIGQEYGLAIPLEAGGGNDIITVAAGEELVQTTNSEVKNTVNQKQVQDLPLNGRSPLQLIQLQAGVAGGGNSARANVTTTINGMRASTASLTQDGINVQDNLFRENSLDLAVNRPTVAQVAEFSVVAQNAGAEVSGGSSAIRTVTPTGTNEFHGSAFEFHRNSALGANDFFNNLQGVAKPQLIRNQFGGTLSGPIIKNKLFFFGVYEGFRQRTANPTTNTILLPNARRGVFTYRDTAGGIRTLDILGLKKLGIDPLVASNVLNQLPQAANANTAGDGLNTSGYSFNKSANNDRNTLTARLDYTMNARHRFEGVFNRSSENVQRGDADTTFAVNPGVVNTNVTYFGVGAWNWIINDRMTNELRIGGTRSQPLFTSSADKPGFFFGTPLVTNPVNQFLDQGRTSGIVSFIDSASYSRGAHFFRFGGQYDRIRTSPFIFPAGSVPTFGLGFGVGAPAGSALVAKDFPGGIDATQLATANGLLALLAGVIANGNAQYEATSQDSGFVKGAPNKRDFQTNQYSFYFTDSWRMRPRLTLNLGLRYDYLGPLTERNNLALLPVANGRSGKDTVLDPNGTVDFVDGGFNKADRNNFAPNISFAWDIPKLGRQTVLRGGYSIAYVNDQAIAAPRNAAGGNDGLSTTVTRNNLFGLLNRDGAGLVSSAFAQPTFKVPRSFADNFRINPAAAAFTVDPNLRTPYFHQWNLSIDREITKDTVLTVRYVGNMSNNLIRGIDYNQVDIFSNGFAADVLRAQQNGFLAQARTGVFDPRYNPAIPGSQVLTVFPKLASGGLLTNTGTIRPLIQRGEAGSLAQVYFQNGLAGSVNFVANPNIFVADVLTNLSESNYHSLQVELRRRFSNGLTFQTNYSYSKNLSNSPGTSTQVIFEPFLDNNQQGVEYSRSQLDVPHIFKANGVYELPFGPGKRFNPDNRILKKVIGGWSVASILVWQTGNPFSITSTRGTLNRGGRSGNNTANSSLTNDQIRDLLGIRFTPNGVYFIDPRVIGRDGRAVAPDGQAAFSGQAFFNPGAGTIGTLSRLSFNGPQFFNWDFSVLKRTAITERINTEFRAEFFNFPNHPIFGVVDQNVNATTFGQSGFQLNSPRIFQVALKIVF
ncbi:MAG: TonB-dependent receptor [Blastocatellia bacterium]|nr:TonB-dependent receptor [Blastocatellia bacterium]